MISRRSSIAIADAYVFEFSFAGGSHHPEKVYNENLYDFLFENDFEAWFCNTAKFPHRQRDLKEWCMKVHTGETIAKATPNWDWDARVKLGQNYLYNLAAAILDPLTDPTKTYYGKSPVDVRDPLIRSLELDGYLYRNKELLKPESDVLDVQEEHGVLQRLYASLALGRVDLATQFLDLSEQHFMSSRWEDCIANSRKFFELTLQECASRHCRAMTGASLPTDTAEKPVKVRDYLERENLLEKKERELIDKTYGLLSHTGSHPYMAKNDQARLLRQIALTVTQFVMLRTEGSLPPEK